MKRYVTLSIVPLLFLSSFVLRAQTSVTSISIPRVGDTVMVVVDNLPQSLRLGFTGPRQIWDLSNLQGPFVTTQKFTSFVKRASDVIVSPADIDSEISEKFVIRKNNQLILLGHKDRHVSELTSKQLYWKDDVLEMKTPIDFKDEYQVKTKAFVDLSLDQFPQDVIDRLPIDADSVRLKVEFSRDDQVDAWGTVFIDEHNYEALRQTRIDSFVYQIEAKERSSKWINISAYLNDNFNLLPWPKVNKSYRFLVEGFVEPLATIMLDEDDQPIKARFIANKDTEITILEDTHVQRGVYVYPNPTFGLVRFEFFNVPEGTYELEVHNLLGRTEWAENIYITENKVFEADLVSLDRGTYFYTLKDERGKRIVTRRLVIINP